MRAQRPVSDAHMAEAVRRGVITAEQMEALLALARSEASPGGALPDLRWTGVVSALAATVAVLAPGLALLFEARSHDELGLAGASGAALVAFGLSGSLARARGWGRAPAAILTAGVAPYAGGVAMFLVCLAPEHWGMARQTAVTTLVAILVGLALWRSRRVGPALAVAGFCLPFAVMAAVRLGWPGETMTLFRMTVLATSLLSLAVASARPSWGRRGGVDGTSWWELGTFAAAALSVTAGFDEGLGGIAVWAPVALLVAALGLLRHRWTYQLAGTLGLLWFLGLGLHDASMAVQSGALVGFCVLVATATQWQRRRESLRVAEREVLSYWE
jgi:hypothetical protein